MYPGVLLHSSLTIHIQHIHTITELVGREFQKFASPFVCVCVHTQLCLSPCNPMDCSLSGSSVHGISQARRLEWIAISSSRGSSRPRGRTCVSCISCIDRWVLHHCATFKALHVCVYRGKKGFSVKI